MSLANFPSVKIPPSELNKLMAVLRDCLGSPFSIAPDAYGLGEPKGCLLILTSDDIKN